MLGAVSAEAAPDEAEARSRRGAEVLSRGKPDEAVGELLKAVELNPQDRTARLNLAYAYDRLGRVEEAISEYKKVVELDPQNTVAHNNLGVLYDKKGLYDEAIRAFDAVLRNDPANLKGTENVATTKKNQAIVQTRERQLAETLSEAKAHPASPVLAYNVSRFYAFYGKRDQAIEWLERALTLGFNDLGYVKVDTALESLRDDSDYRWLVRGR
jgi:tetratricopeptide (TPR) repeat protein